MANIANIEAVLERLRAGPLPLPLDRWRVETGPDWSNHPAVWVWIPLEDADSADLEVDKLVELQDIVHERVKGAVDDDSLVYVRFNDISEFEKTS